MAKKIITSPSYRTTVSSNQWSSVEKATNKLEQLRVIGDESLLTVGENIYALTDHGQDSIPTFLHPIVTKEGITYVDVRGYVNKQGAVRSRNDYNLAVRRGRMDQVLAMDPDLFMGQEAFVVDVFSSWFANGIGTRLDLPLLAVANIRILAAVYYYGLMNQPDLRDDTEETVTLLLKQLPKMTRIPSEVMSDLFSVSEAAIEDLYKVSANHEGESTLDVLVTVITTILESEYHIDKATIHQSLVNGAFVGIGAAQIVGVAIESPPQFMLLMEYSLQKGVYSKTTIGRNVNSLARRHNVSRFEKFMINLQHPED